MPLLPQPVLHSWEPPSHLGARLDADRGCEFRVWAPRAQRVELVLLEDGRRIPLNHEARGYCSVSVAGVEEGQRYRFDVDGEEFADPASRWQPEGVHGPSAVLAEAFAWSDADWRGIPLPDYVIYELHVGTFTPEGTFEAVIPRLAALRELGITAIELLPIAEFPGSRNWGYDGVFPFAAQSSYGGPQGLRRLVDAAHAAGLAIILDVVYNHLGPEGNYLPRFGPYFTDRYRTPWGNALNFDGEYSDEVRAFFIASALQWIDEFHVDALRIDAIHAIIDASAYPFLCELADAVRTRAAALGREVVLFAESDLADPRIIRPAEQGGMNMHAQWVDDFHHALHAIVTGERQGYYVDFGELAHLARAFQQGYVYAGDFTEFRKRRHGQRPGAAEPHQFVVFAQNHDQVGNRLAGDRLSASLAPTQLGLIAAAVILSPFVPLLFMGEEYGETAPFPYFVSHGDPDLVEAVRHGRREEFAAFAWDAEPPDPQAESTFARAVLRWQRRCDGEHARLLRLHRELLQLRRAHRDVLVGFETIETRHGIDAGGPGLLQVLRSTPRRHALLLLNFAPVPARSPLPAGEWRTVFDSAGDARAAGSSGRFDVEVAGYAAMLLIRETP
jgi:maltooligosyltrehalose trehalohydrolase